MRYINSLVALFLYVVLLSSSAFAQGSAESPYIEAQKDNGQIIILKRDFEAEAKVEIQPLAGCITYNSSASGGYLAGGNSVVAYSYSTSCAGYHTATGLSKTPFSAYIRVELQKLSGGIWQPVANGTGYFYNGSAGQYRIVVNNLGTVTATTWSFDYSLPL